MVMLTKKDRVKQALLIRNEALAQAKAEFLQNLAALNLPKFKLDFSEAMYAESKRQDLLIAPIRQIYFNARTEAFRIYKESCK